MCDTDSERDSMQRGILQSGGVGDMSTVSGRVRVQQQVGTAGGVQCGRVCGSRQHSVQQVSGGTVLCNSRDDGRVLAGIVLD